MSSFYLASLALKPIHMYQSGGGNALDLSINLIYGLCTSKYALGIMSLTYHQLLSFYCQIVIYMVLNACLLIVVTHPDPVSNFLSQIQVESILNSYSPIRS